MFGKKGDKNRGLPRKLVEILSGEAFSAIEERWAAEERAEAEAQTGLLPKEREILGLKIGEPTLMTLQSMQAVENGIFAGGTISFTDFPEIVALLILTSHKVFRKMAPLWRRGEYNEGVLVQMVNDLANKIRYLVLSYPVDEIMREITEYCRIAGVDIPGPEKKSEEVKP